MKKSMPSDVRFYSFFDSVVVKAIIFVVATALGIFALAKYASTTDSKLLFGTIILLYWSYIVGLLVLKVSSLLREYNLKFFSNKKQLLTAICALIGIILIAALNIDSQKLFPSGIGTIAILCSLSLVAAALVVGLGRVGYLLIPAVIHRARSDKWLRSIKNTDETFAAARKLGIYLVTETGEICVPQEVWRSFSLPVFSRFLGDLTFGLFFKQGTRVHAGLGPKTAVSLMDSFVQAFGYDELRLITLLSNVNIRHSSTYAAEALDCAWDNSLIRHLRQHKTRPDKTANV